MLYEWSDLQFRVAQEWITQDLNHPGKLEHYVMRAALEASRFTAKDPNKVTLHDMRVEFKRPTKQSPVTLEQASRIHNDKWGRIYD